jgi:hypothetical protein
MLMIKTDLLNQYWFLINFIKTIDHILTNPDYPLNFTSEIEILNVLLKIFHLNSTIAFLQEKNSIL